MANKTITNLPAVVTPSLSDTLETVNGGSSKKLTLTQVKAVTQAGISNVNTSDAGLSVAVVSGVATITIPGGGLPVSRGGTGATSAASARTNLGITANATLVNNFAASAIPTASNDDLAGYTVGSRWVVVSGVNTGRMFVARVVTTAGAIWQEIVYNGGPDLPVADGGTGSSTAIGARTNLGINAAAAALSNLTAAVAPTVTDDSGGGYSVGSRWINTITGVVFECVNSGVGVAVWSELTTKPPVAEMIVNTPAATTIAVAGTFYKGEGTTLLSAGSINFNMPVDNRLRYTGVLTKLFHVVSVISYSVASGANQQMRARIYKNGVFISGSEILDTITTSADINSSSVNTLVELATNDYLEIFITNSSSTNNITLQTINMFALGIPKA